MSSTSFSVPYDLTRVRQYAKDPLALRLALCALARFSLKHERYEDACRVMRELVRGVASGQLGSQPPSLSVTMSITGLGPSSAFPPSTPPPSSFSSPAGPSSLCTDPKDLTLEERQTLYLSYKHYVCALRQQWRCLKLEDVASLSAPSPPPAKGQELAADFTQQIEKEIYLACSDLTQLLEQTLIPAINSAEGKTFYLKLAADFYRYLAEVAFSIVGVASLPSPVPSAIVPAGFEKKSNEYYSAAYKLACSVLDPTHPTRLSVALNFSVLLYETIKDRKSACEVARNAFDASIGRLDELDEGFYKESTVLMQLMRDNLTLWTAQE